jgi:hypothetical protein
MKVVFLLIAMATVQIVNAQDYCKFVKKDVSPDKTVVEFTAPFDATDIYAMRVTRNYSVNTDEPYDNFYIIFQQVGEINQIYSQTPEGEQTEKEEKALIVEFDDKSKYVDDTIKIAHDFTTDRTQATRFVYYPLTPANVKDFSTKKIVKYSLAGYEHTAIPDSANSVMHYIKCMQAAR